MTDKIYVVTASANKGQDWIICKALYGGILGSDIKKTAQAMLEEEYQDIKMHGKRIPRKYFKLTEYSDNAELLKQIEQLKAENAALKERLNKAIELPCKVGDTLYEPFADNVIREWIVESIYVGRIGIRATCHRKDDYKWHDSFAIGKYYNDFGEKGRVCFTREAAKARLKEKGGRE